MTTQHDPFEWLVRESVYQPTPRTIEPARPEPIPLGWKVFLWLAVAALACGALIAAFGVM